MQMHLYLPDELALEVRKRAKANGIPVSRYLAELVRRQVSGGWPEGFFEAVVGKWVGELRRPPQGDAEPRERL